MSETGAVLLEWGGNCRAGAQTKLGSGFVRQPGSRLDRWMNHKPGTTRSNAKRSRPQQFSRPDHGHRQHREVAVDGHPERALAKFDQFATAAARALGEEQDAGASRQPAHRAVDRVTGLVGIASIDEDMADGAATLGDERQLSDLGLHDSADPD